MWLYSNGLGKLFSLSGGGCCLQKSDKKCVHIKSSSRVIWLILCRSLFFFFFRSHNVLSVHIRAVDIWEKARFVREGRACRVSFCLLSWGFEVINHSGQIYSKTIVQRKTQTEWERERGGRGWSREGGEGEGEREVESNSEMEERGVMSSERTKERHFEIDWGLRKKSDKYGLYNWRIWHQTPVCIAEMQIHESERMGGRK